MDILPDYCKKRVLILGCGNTLFGDDGFGPAVVEYLQKDYELPPDVCIIDAGTSASEILFTITLSEVRPQKIIIIDAVDAGRTPGEIFGLPLNALPNKKSYCFSLHHFPTANLLTELQNFCNIGVRIFVSQVENIPQQVSPGLSATLTNSIPLMCEIIMKHLSQ